MIDKRKRLATFKKWFEHYRKRFGLMGYIVFYHCRPIEGCYQAEILADDIDRGVTVSISDGHLDSSVRTNAKHEAIHLLIDHLNSLACNRYVSKDEIKRADEVLVDTLEGLIPG